MFGERPNSFLKSYTFRSPSVKALLDIMARRRKLDGGKAYIAACPDGTQEPDLQQLREAIDVQEARRERFAALPGYLAHAANLAIRYPDVFVPDLHEYWDATNGKCVQPSSVRTYLTQVFVRLGIDGGRKELIAKFRTIVDPTPEERLFESLAHHVVSTAK